MTSTLYCLCSNSYKSKIFTGFSQLQKQEEFVDLTLAVDGCMVKVHRSLIALASPYLREILKTLGNHPVIFLNNVSHQVLSYLLEYIYQGQVDIPADSVDTFIEVSKSLYITGIEDIEPPKMTKNHKLTVNRNKPPEQKPSNIAAHKTINNDNLMEVQQPLPSDNADYNVHYETENNMDNQHQAANIINNANFIVLQNQEPQNTGMSNNVPVIDTNTKNFQDQFVSNINFVQNHTNIPDQSQTNTETKKNIPVIEITTGNMAEQHNMETDATQSKDYKIIFKTQHKVNQTAETEALQNIPVIEIQHLGIPSQQDQNPTQNINILPNLLDQNATVDDFSILPMQTDMMPEAFQENPTQMSITQNQINKKNKHFIRILGNETIKPGVTSEINGGQTQTVLGEEDSVVSSDLKMNMDSLKNMAQFSVTERGNLQLILNRYMYCCHHSSRTKRRWRCIDYRRGACPALVDTQDGAIVARKGIHAHSYHDDKIYKKHKKGLIYQTIGLAVTAKHSAEQEKLRTIAIDSTDDEELKT